MLSLAMQTSSLLHTWSIRQSKLVVVENHIWDGMGSPIMPWFLVILALLGCETVTAHLMAGVERHRLI
jgi:hypothetical protein